MTHESILIDLRPKVHFEVLRIIGPILATPPPPFDLTYNPPHMISPNTKSEMKSTDYDYDLPHACLVVSLAVSQGLTIVLLDARSVCCRTSCENRENCNQIPSLRHIRPANNARQIQQKPIQFAAVTREAVGHLSVPECRQIRSVAI